MKYRILTTLAGLAALATAQANLIDNGSFENTTGTSIDDWTLTPFATSGSVAAYQGIGATGTSVYGPKFLVFNAGNTAPVGSATQDFGSTIALQTYVVSFAYGQYGGQAGDQTLLVTINQTSVPLLLQSQTVTNIVPSNDFGTIWKRASFTFVGTGLQTGITFSDAGTTNTNNVDLFVDDVSIEAVPEPASLAALGLGAMVALRRRRRA